MRPKPNKDLGDFDFFRYRVSNRYFTSLLLGAALSNANPDGGYIYATPFYVPTIFKADRIAINVTTADAEVFRAGVYQDDGSCYPGKLLADSGDLSASTTGVKEVTIDLILRKNLYWLAFYSPNTLDAAIRTIVQGASIATFLGISSGLGTVLGILWRVAYAGSVLPDPFTSGGSVNTIVDAPAVFLRKAA